MSYICDCCKEEFNYSDEMTFIDRDGNVLTESDLYNEWILPNKQFCNICWEKIE